MRTNQKIQSGNPSPFFLCKNSSKSALFANCYGRGRDHKRHALNQSLYVCTRSILRYFSKIGKKGNNIRIMHYCAIVRLCYQKLYFSCKTCINSIGAKSFAPLIQKTNMRVMRNTNTKPIYRTNHFEFCVQTLSRNLSSNTPHLN